MADKGGKYEREMSRRLSLWWTYDERDDVFWRVRGSGGRAKSRGNKGQSTYGQHSDICATDPIGDPLTRKMVIELKRGHNKFTPYDLMDAPSCAQQMIESWIQQVREARDQSGAYGWLIIHKRDHREEVVMFPQYILTKFQAAGVLTTLPVPHMRMQTRLTYRLVEKKGKSKKVTEWVDQKRFVTVSMWLKDFLENVSPQDIRNLPTL